MNVVGYYERCKLLIAVHNSGLSISIGFCPIQSSVVHHTTLGLEHQFSKFICLQIALAFESRNRLPCSVT